MVYGEPSARRLRLRRLFSVSTKSVSTSSNLVKREPCIMSILFLGGVKLDVQGNIKGKGECANIDHVKLNPSIVDLPEVKKMIPANWPRLWLPPSTSQETLRPPSDPWCSQWNLAKMASRRGCRVDTPRITDVYPLAWAVHESVCLCKLDGYHTIYDQQPKCDVGATKHSHHFVCIYRFQWPNSKTIMWRSLQPFPPHLGSQS